MKTRELGKGTKRVRLDAPAVLLVPQPPIHVH
jgi:hypothetical protein